MRRDLWLYLRGWDQQPQQVLGDFMRQHFADRIAEKRHVLPALATARGPVALPSPDADVGTEIPATVDLCPPGRRPVQRLTRSAIAMLVIGIAAASLALVGGFARRPPAGRKPAPAPSAVVAPAPTAARAPASLRSGTVRIEIQTTPSGAVVIIDGEQRGVTPLAVDERRGDHPVRVVVRKSGYAASSQTLRPTSDQVLRLSLARRPGRKPGRRPAGKPLAPSVRLSHPSVMRLVRGCGGPRGRPGWIMTMTASASWFLDVVIREVYVRGFHDHDRHSCFWLRLGHD